MLTELKTLFKSSGTWWFGDGAISNVASDDLPGGFSRQRHFPFVRQA